MTYPAGGDYPSSAFPQGAGTRTFRQLQDEALGDDFDAGKYRDQVKGWLNEALGKIGRRVAPIGPLQGTAHIVTTTDVATYEMPVDGVRVLSLREPSTSTPIDDVGIDAIDQSVASRGKPYAFAIWNGQITFYPTPDGEYTFEQRYERDGGSLTADTDTSPIPDAYADLPVSYARSKLFRAEDDAEMTAFYRSEFDRELQEMKADLGRQNRGRVRQVPGMWDRPSTAPRFQEP